MKKKILAEDIKALLKLFAPDKYSLSIFDPFLKLDTADGLGGEFMNQEHKVLVNLGNEIVRYKQYDLNEFDLILNFGTCKTDHLYTEKIRYKSNKNGGMKWLFKPQNLKHVLTTYSANNLRSKILKKGVETMCALRLGKLFSTGTLEIRSNNEMPFQQFASSMDEAVVFMGTPGLQRKLTLAQFKGKEVTDFVKIPMNLFGEKNNVNEAKILGKLKEFNFESFVYPDQFSLENACLKQNNHTSFKSQSNGLKSEYQNALLEIINKSKDQKKLWNTSFISNINKNLELLSMTATPEFNPHIERAKKMFKNLDQSTKIYTSLSHGDFTPWNLKHDNGKAYLFDWEYGNENMPILYDLFHFVIQSAIYTQRNFNLKLKEVLRTIEGTQLHMFIQKSEINIEEYLQLYIIHQLSYHLACVQFDNRVSDGLKIQIDTLYKLSIEMKKQSTSESYRTLFLDNFQEFLVRSTGYTLMKFDSKNLNELSESSDLDILVTKSFEKEIVNYIESLEWRANVKRFRKSFMTKLRITFYDGSILYIDLIREFKRKSITFLNAKSVLEKGMKLNNGLRVPLPEHDFEYAFLFYNMNGADIPEKYFNFFSKEGVYAHRIEDYINEKYNLEACQYDELFKLDSTQQSWLNKKVAYQTKRNPLNFVASYFRYLSDTFRSAIYDTGFVITFSGVDGSGKSTIIEEFKTQLRSIHRREIVMMRHRPRILPILSSIKHGGVQSAEEHAGTVKPRQGKAKAGVGSYLRFGYYYLDYLIGQTYVYCKYVLRGKIVLYDRYYFDFIVDAKRSNISINPKLVRRLYSFIYKPKYNFLLWSKAEDVYARKPEVEVGQIRELNEGYKGLFRELSSTAKKHKYSVIQNKKINTTIKQILHECREVA